MTRIRTGFRMAGSIFVIIGFLAGTVLAGDGLVDPGFEAGTLDGDTESWDVVIESDSVTVVDSEGPADSSAYADAAPQITVTPTSGQWMLRLGSPKQQPEKQELGSNTVTQTFTPASDTHTYTFRLFSWEHRGDDVLRFDIRHAGGERIVGASLDISSGSNFFGTCDATTYLCELVIGDGKRDELLDTGWIQVIISGLPLSELTLEYTLIGGENKAHASWVYIDEPANPALSIDKSASHATYDAVGQRIIYLYQVTNSGNVNLHGPFTIDDDKSTDESCPAAPEILAPGNSMTCRASYTITQTDLDAGSVTNVALASGADRNGNPVTSTTDTETVYADQKPAIVIEKTADVTDYNKVGDKITYTLLVENKGNVTLTSVTITDLLTGLPAIDCDSGSSVIAALAPAEAVSCTTTYNITQSDIDVGSVTNVASVAGKDLNEVDVISPTDTATVTAIQTPAIDITKTAAPTIYKRADDVITYTLVVNNTGNVTLTNVTVTDLLAGLSAIDCGSGSRGIATLAPAEAVSCSATYTIGQSDIFGSVVNKATARGTPPSSLPNVEDTDSQTVTWGNSPPVANFSFDTNIMEGDLVAFTDESTDPDIVDGDTISWKWTITGSSQEITEQHPTFIFPDNGDFVVTLTVTDSYGASNTISSSDLILNGKPVAAGLGTENMPPLVSVLNQEVLACETVTVCEEGEENTVCEKVPTCETTELFGRFIDPGYMDSHTASWQIDGGTLGETTVDQTYGIPFSTTGTALASFQAPISESLPDSGSLSLPGSLTITDKDGAATEKLFEIIVLNELDQREPNNNLIDAPVLNSGWIYRSNIALVGDIDIFEVALPNGGALPAGSEVLVKLKELPADYDIVVLSYLPDDASATAWLKNAWLKNAWLKNAWLKNAWLGVAWLKNAWLDSAWLKNAWLKNPWDSTAWLKNAWLKNAWLKNAWLKNPWVDTAWLKNAWLKNEYFVQQIPLSDFAQDEFLGEEIGGSDLAISELPLDLLKLEGVSVTGISANRGLLDDIVLVRTDYPGTRVFVAVVPSNGAFSTAPYALQIETSIPVNLVDLLGTSCDGDPLVTNHAPTALTGSESPRTLFVTQKERFDAVHDDPLNDVVGSWDSVEANLAQMATIEDFAILNIDSFVYDNWDKNSCSVEAANDVSTFIRNEIFGILSTTPSIEYVVFIGSDNIIPYRRVPDETAISNEKLYMDSQLIPGTPLFISTYLGYNLTDDYYVDNQPMFIQGRELYIPKLSNARLVETPTEINSSIAAFVSSGGILNLSTSLVTGYDFFQDGAQLAADNLDQALDTPDTLISDDWDLLDLNCALLGEGVGCTTTPHDISIVNMHYNHYGAITARGYNTGDYDDVLSSVDILDLGGKLSDGVYATIGCHSGLSVPDGWAFDGSVAGTTDPNLDFPQVMGAQNILQVGSTGFGLGTDDGVGGTEKLIAMFAAELTKGGTVGQALVRAKQDYINNLNTISVYDEKSSIQTILYGLPMYRPGGTIASTARFATVAVDSFTDIYTHTEVEVPSEGPDKGSKGSYFTVVNGEYQATAFRAIQPKKVIDVTSSDPSYPVHGVLITGGTYTDKADFDPVISRPQNWWEPSQGAYDPPICLDAYWPIRIATINSLPVLGDLKQSLVLIPGQFRCTEIVQEPEGVEKVIGIQRQITGLAYELTGSSKPDNADFSLPVINAVDLGTDGAALQFAVDAYDDSAIEQIVLLIFDSGDINSYSITTSGPGPYALNVPLPSVSAEMLLQVVDDAGNIAYWSNKGAKIRLLKVDAGIGASLSSLQGVPTTLSGTVYDFQTLMNEANSIFYRWEFGDGNYKFGILAENHVPSDIVTIDEDGHAHFEVEYQYGITFADVTATLKVTDDLGGIGVDDVINRFDIFPCDPADLDSSLAHLDYVGCGVTNDSTVVSIYLEMAAVVSGDNQFRIHLDLNNDGKDDEMLKYNTGNGSTTGLASLIVTQSPEDEMVIFSFDMAELGFTGEETFQWYAETQDGVSAGNGQGFVDRMPDAGYFTYTLTP